MKEEAKEILEKYLTFDNLNLMQDLYKNREMYTKREGRGGIYFHRGTYSHEILSDLHVTNIHRGKVLTRSSRTAPDFHYYFDENQRMFLCVKEPYDCAELTWIQKTEIGDFSISVPLVENIDFIKIAETTYNQGKIIKYQQFNYQLDDEINTLDKLILHLNNVEKVEQLDVSLDSFRIEELYYQNNKISKGILKYDETAYRSNSRVEEYEFHFKYENGKLVNQRDVVELNKPFTSKPKIREWLDSLPCDDHFSKADIALIESINNGDIL